jgi:pimeloyl-ACP methyl ester carboxylesterase
VRGVRALILIGLLLAACGPKARPAVAKPCPPTNGKFVQAKGATIHVSVYGADATTKPIVVLLHGWARDGSVFYPQIAALAGRFLVVTIDLRGHGESIDESHAGGDLATHARDVEAVLAQIGQPVHLVGHDLGALVALRVALDAPAAVKTLTLLSPAVVADTRLRTSYLQVVADYKVDQASYHGWSSLAAGWIGGPYLEAHPELVAFFDAIMERHDHDSVIATLVATIDATIPDAELAKLSVPTLVIYGTGEGWQGAMDSEKKLAALPVVKVQRVSGAVHETYLEAADLVNAALIEHLK